MIRIAALLSILLTTSANSECWIVTNLHGYGAMNGDRYEFTKDSTEDSVFHVKINGDKSSVYESVSGVYPEMKYICFVIEHYGRRIPVWRRNNR